MKGLTDAYQLNNGATIPCVGFGTWQTPNDDIGYQAVLTALKAGYRHIDTAAIYGNEEAVGRAMRDSGLRREDIFLTTKLWNNMHGYENTKEAFETSLAKLGTDYVDLYLIHWPNPKQFRDNWEEANAGSWKAMEEIYEAGKSKTIGVSNFRIHHMEALLKTAKIMPMVNQIKLCPGVLPQELIDYCKEKDILLEAYSPFGTGKIFEVPEIQAIADKHHTSVGNVALKWSIEKGFLPLPKSVTPERIVANGQFFDVVLEDEDIAAIDRLEGVGGYVADPDRADW